MTSHFLPTLLGSVALLLWGVRMVRTGMTRAFGAALRKVLAACSRSRWTAFGAGLGVTGLLQSSTATALLIASFSARRLVSLPAALAMMIGADVGTAVVAQVFSLDVKWLWSVAVLAGVAAFTASDQDRTRACGRILIGLGLMMLALGLIAGAAAPLAASDGFGVLLAVLRDQPLALVLLAAVATWLAHSSLSIVLFVTSLAAGGVLPLQASLALVLGANAGGAIAPYAALAHAVPAARRVPLGNLAMRSSAALLALPALPAIGAWIADAGLTAGPATVLFHLAFNLVLALVFLPCVGQVARLCDHVLPEPEEAVRAAGEARHLDPGALDTPAEALACATREALHMGERIADMMRLAMAALETDDARKVRDLGRADDAVDRLNEQVKLYLMRVSQAGMSEEESRRHVEILTFATNLEHVGDIIDKNLMELAAKKIRHRLTFSPEGLADLRAFHARVCDTLKLALNVFTSRDIALARRLVAEKAALRAVEQVAAERHFARLREGRPETLETSAIHLDVIRDLKRINGHLAAAANPILEAAGELGETRLRGTTPASLAPALARSGPA
jgi:phosphate:Na+ symporter